MSDDDSSAALKLKAEAGAAFKGEDWVAASTMYCQALAALSAEDAAGGNTELAVILHSNVSECSLRMANFKNAAHHAEQALELDRAHEKSIRRLKLAKEQLEKAAAPKEEEREEDGDEEESSEDEEEHIETFTVVCPDGLSAGDTMYVLFTEDDDEDDIEEVFAQKEKPAPAADGSSEFFSVVVPEGVVAGGEVEVNILYDGSIIAHRALAEGEEVFIEQQPEPEAADWSSAAAGVTGGGGGGGTQVDVALLKRMSETDSEAPDLD